MMIIKEGKFYSVKSPLGFIHLVTPVTVKDSFIVCKPIASEVPLKFFGTTEFSTLSEVPKKDLPLWIGSKYVAPELEDILKG